ncbi:MAG TPA: G/U mismatch-specific DNA glycosylase [Rhizomicrobium sp.]|jgi:TDG/mug DNA glycosylase family protein
MVESLPDILAHDLSIVFCGINPARTAAVVGRHFASGTNRFWRVLHLSGFTPELIRPENDRSILRYGYGLTTAVARPTRSANELSRGELAGAGAVLERKLAPLKPRHIAFLGKMAYAAIVKNPKLDWGPQPASFAGAPVWVLPNPSGLNRAFQLDALVAAYREMRVAVIG